MPLIDLPALAPVIRLSCTGDESCLPSWKILFAAILLVEGLLFAHLVLVARKFSPSKFEKVALIGNAFAAGVFLSAGLLHIFPEGVELLAAEDEHAEGEVVRMGFKVARKLYKVMRQEDDHNHEEEEDGHDGHNHEEEHGHDHGFPWAFFIAGVTFYVLYFVEQVALPHAQSKIHAKNAPPDEEDQALNPEQEEPRDERVGFKSGAFVQGFVQVLALSLHSLFESMIIGLGTEFTIILNVFIATAAHRWVTAAAIAFKLVNKLRYWAFLTLILLFSVAVPLGVGIGAALSGLSDTLEGVMFAISAGTFLYIGGYELMHEGKGTYWEFASIIVGWTTVSVITAILSRYVAH